MIKLLTAIKLFLNKKAFIDRAQQLPVRICPVSMARLLGELLLEGDPWTNYSSDLAIKSTYTVLSCSSGFNNVTYKCDAESLQMLILLMRKNNVLSRAYFKNYFLNYPMW